MEEKLEEILKRLREQKQRIEAQLQMERDPKIVAEMERDLEKVEREIQEKAEVIQVDSLRKRKEEIEEMLKEEKDPMLIAEMTADLEKIETEIQRKAKDYGTEMEDKNLAQDNVIEETIMNEMKELQESLVSLQKNKEEIEQALGNERDTRIAGEMKSDLLKIEQEITDKSTRLDLLKSTYHISEEEMKKDLDNETEPEEVSEVEAEPEEETPEVEAEPEEETPEVEAEPEEAPEVEAEPEEETPEMEEVEAVSQTETNIEGLTRDEIFYEILGTIKDVIGLSKLYNMELEEVEEMVSNVMFPEVEKEDISALLSWVDKSSDKEMEEEFYETPDADEVIKEMLGADRKTVFERREKLYDLVIEKGTEKKESKSEDIENPMSSVTLTPEEVKALLEEDEPEIDEEVRARMEREESKPEDIEEPEIDEEDSKLEEWLEKFERLYNKMQDIRSQGLSKVYQLYRELPGEIAGKMDDLYQLSDEEVEEVLNKIDEMEQNDHEEIEEPESEDAKKPKSKKLPPLPKETGFDRLLHFGGRMLHRVFTPIRWIGRKLSGGRFKNGVFGGIFAKMADLAKDCVEAFSFNDLDEYEIYEENEETQRDESIIDMEDRVVSETERSEERRSMDEEFVEEVKQRKMLSMAGDEQENEEIYDVINRVRRLGDTSDLLRLQRFIGEGRPLTRPTKIADDQGNEVWLNPDGTARMVTEEEKNALPPTTNPWEEKREEEKAKKVQEGYRDEEDENGLNFDINYQINQPYEGYQMERDESISEPHRSSTDFVESILASLRVPEETEAQYDDGLKPLPQEYVERINIVGMEAGTNDNGAETEAMEDLESELDLEAEMDLDLF